MKVLVLGGNGLIGDAVVRALRRCGHRVAALGRETRTSRARLPDVAWISADLSALTTAAAWEALLVQVVPDVIVNCSGALQDGLRDRVSTVQAASMRALFEAAAATGCRRLIQISATRASVEAGTEFMRSKGEADAALRASALDWTILRPGLVMAPQAYGGTALLRALALAPVAIPLPFATSAIQTVWVEDVADSVMAVIDGRVASRQDYDLVEDAPRALRDVVLAMRGWLGLPPAPVIEVPAWAARVLARVGDGLGWLGWRSPLRSTAVTELEAGVRGDPGPWRAAYGASMLGFEATLERLPSTVQERWFGRAFVLKPVVTGVLCVFWCLSGMIAMGHADQAARVLTVRGVTGDVALFLVLAGALADIVLGCAILVRDWSVRAAQGMALLTLGYLVGGTVLAPDLWADPLGPLLKALPVLALCLVPLVLADDR